jgi:hypothetical protein
MWWAYVIVFLLSFIGGYATKVGVDSTQPPKVSIQNINTTQNVDSQNENVQSSIQESVNMNVVSGRTNYTITVVYNGRTNISHVFSSKTNRMSKTNVSKTTNNFIPGVKLPTIKH